MKSIIIDVTTDGAGAATVYSGVTKGAVHSATYLKDATVPFTDGVDFAITVDKTGDGLWTQVDQNASATKYPRIGVHDLVGVAATLDGTRAMRDKVTVAQDRLKIVIAAGGAAKKGRFVFLLDD